MSTGDQYIGRREAVGLGIEGTPGTSVAPQIWMRWLDNDLQVKTDVQENESALGVVDRVNDSDITSKWVEGKIGGNISSRAVGYLLLGMWGNVSTGSATGGIYPHTFSVKQSSIPTTLTIAKSSPLASARHSYGTLSSFELDAQPGKYVTVSSAVKARIGATSTETVALSTEATFTSRHISVYTADTVANLASATKIKAASFKLNVERKVDAFMPLGENSSVPAVEFDAGTFEAKGELVVRLTDTQYETDFLANTIRAMKIALVNGTKSLEFTAAKVRFRELEKSTDRDSVVTATLSFFCEFDETTNASITPVLKTDQATYIAA